MDMSEKITCSVVGLMGGLIVLTIGIIVGGAEDHQQNLIAKELAQKVLRSSIELKWSSPVRIEQVFLVDSTQYSQRFMCDTSQGDGNSEIYYTEGHCYRAPKVGEWWDLAINAQGDKYLYSIDFDKTKKENGGDLP